MRRRFVQVGTELVEVGGTGFVLSPAILDDLDPFVDTSGQVIEGKRQWREHLKRTGSVEFSRDELAQMAERQTRKTLTKSVSLPNHPGEARPMERSQTTARVLERLHGRPTPSRVELIQLAIEERKRG